ncbi:gfo/Idh/MocA family oxidoreductase [Candidatus Parcubacteria bacterium]|jgi:predicted dehydrogenase|nr:MAG: gfo/Idh/MocA family oxidoreductase [Candidatus Parcubacteria bacterium]
MNGTDSQSMDKRRVAIVGCGTVAGDIDDDAKKRHIYGHAKAISMVKQFELTACCDRDENRLRTFTGRWKVPVQYLDLQEMLHKEQIDILVIATPTKTHYENVLLALSSDVKVIFCEKPITFDLLQSIELVKKAEESGKLLIVNYARRWDEFYAECKSLLESGELGRIETIVAYTDTALYMNSSHMLDMLIYFGGDVFSCVGHIDRINNIRVVHGEKDFGGIALIKHKNGIISFVKATGESQKNHFFELDIQCTKGRLRILDDDMRYEVYKFRESPQHKGLDELAIDYTRANDSKSERVVNAYLDILNCIENRKEPKFPAKEALKSLELVNLIYKSDSTGNLPIYSLLREIL